eukprot:6052679-Pleurochrysis_carterae.AAC.2
MASPERWLQPASSASETAAVTETLLRCQPARQGAGWAQLATEGEERKAKTMSDTAVNRVGVVAGGEQ